MLNSLLTGGMMEQQFKGTDDYIADQGLLADVNAAIVLEKPLLVRGEPGTGKTMLAEAYQRHWGCD